MDRKKLIAEAGEYGIPLHEEQAQAFAVYEDLLLDWNGRMNLTAITDPDGVRVKHFLDSLLALAATELPQGSSLLDVGTGAGFPGVPLKIQRPDLQLTLLDSLQNRIRFLQALSAALHQENRTLHGRAEELAHDLSLRERFDAVAARAVAALPALCEYCLPFVRVGGVFLAMKGGEGEQELEQAGGALALLGGEPEACRPFRLPGGDRRCILVIRKTARTPAGYPRRRTKIVKKPL